MKGRFVDIVVLIAFRMEKGVSINAKDLRKNPSCILDGLYMGKDDIRPNTYLRTAIAPGSSMMDKGESTAKLSQRFTKDRRMRPCETCGSHSSVTADDARRGEGKLQFSVK